MKRILSIVVAVTLMLSLIPATLAFANGYSVSASPLVEANVVGEEHTVTVTIEPALGYEEYAEVYFEVSDGPNVGDNTTVNLYEGDSEAVFIYPGDGGSGLDFIEIDVEINDVGYSIPVEINGVAYPSNCVYKVWLEDKFSGGGKIIQEDEEAKRKDWNKISWGGWAGNIEGFPIGQFEVTFHNVSVDELDKAKFVSEDEYLGITELNWLWYGQADGPDADPPESDANFVWLQIPGSLEFPDDTVDDNWTLGIRATDNGEPGNIDESGEVCSDAIVFALWYDGYLVYESFLTGDFEADQDCNWTLRHELDSGNLQIVVPPPIVV